MTDMKRRTFLSHLGATAAATTLAGAVAHAAARNPRAAAPDPSGTAEGTLILIELAGGNDGLNTVIPLDQLATYRQLRPRLAIERDQLVQIGERVGLHPSLEPLHALFKAGELAVVEGVGYPKPNRSHFRSIEIWDTASDSDRVIDDGWIATAVRTDPRRALDALVLGDRDPGPIDAPDLRVLTMDRREGVLNQARRLTSYEQANANPALAHILKVQGDVINAAASLTRRLRKTPEPAGFARDAFGRQMQIVTRVLQSGLVLPVVKVSIGSFDTHANQLGRHKRLLESLAQGIAAMRKSLSASGHWANTTLMTYSEFGRRATENQSRGTDHGTAAAHFVMGGRVRGGLYGEAPRLDRLVNGDLLHTVDFRRLYRSVADDVLKADSPRLAAFDKLKLLRG